MTEQTKKPDFGGNSSSFNIASNAMNALGSTTPTAHHGMYSPYKIIKRQQQEITELERDRLTDPLTKAKSFKGLEKAFKEEISRIERGHSVGMALVALDLNKFKPINDTYGHHAGDEVLKTFAKRLENKLRVTDTVCRKSGDEFWVLVDNTMADDFQTHFKNVLQDVCKDPVIVDGHKIKTDSSFGIAVYDPENGLSTLEEMMKSADKNMYDNKPDARNASRYTEPPAP